MFNRILQRLKMLPAINPQAIQTAGTINGTTIDRYAPVPTQPTSITAYTAVNDSAGIYNTAVVGVATGVSTGAPTAQSVTYKLQHGTLANGSDMVDVPASAYVDSNGSSATVSPITADSSNSYIGVNLEGLNRYIRVVAVLAFTGGTSPAQFVGAFVSLGDAINSPIS